MNSTMISLPPAKPNSKMQIELTRHLYRQLLVSLPALVILATVVVWGVARFTNIYYLTIWYCTFLGIIALRGLLVIWYHYTKTHKDLCRLHYLLFVINTTLIAILWGISDSLLMPHTLNSQFLVIIIMAGVTAGATASLMPSFLASTLYTTLSLVPMIIWLIFQGNQSIYFSLSIVITTYWLFLLMVGYRGYALFVRNVKLTLEKIELIDSLSFTNNQLTLSVDNLKAVNLALYESEERFHQAFDYAAIGMALVSPAGLWLKVNKALCDLVGYTETEMLKMNYQTITYADDLINEDQHIQQMIEGKLKTYQTEKRYVCKDGQVIWTLLNRVLVRDADGEPLYFISQIQNIDLQKKAESELRYIAYHDALTQLDNRKMLGIKFQQVLGYAQRNNYGFAVLYIDIDYFKRVNDTLGHDGGDALLQAMALRLREYKRQTDILARLGGDEFVLVLTEVMNENEIRAFIEKLQTAIAKDFIINGNTLNLTTSIGVSFYPKDGKSLEVLLKNADIALYRVKKAGRNGFQFYYPDPVNPGSAN